jgi:hypothetical protein
MLVGNDQVVVNGVLVMYNSFDGVLAGYDLAVEDAPLASLPGESALAAAQTEAAGEERMICDRLVRLPKLDEHWLRVLEHPQDPLLYCALRRFEAAPQRQAGPLLRRLAERPLSPESELTIGSILRTLAQDDSHETSTWLAAFVARARADRGMNKWEREWSIGSVWEQLWRTGRTSEFGFCPQTARVHHVDELDKHAGDGAIGTAHPLIFQGVATDGRWTLVCQARQDTTADGKTEVMIGHHGEPLGDEVSPYVVVADLRDEGSFGSHRGIAFDRTGTRMLYLRGGEKTAIVLRDLVNGAETVMDPGPGLVLSARFDPEGRGLEVVTSPSGEWPHVASTLSKRRCRGAVSSFSTFGGTMPHTTLRYLPFDAGPVVDDEGLLRMFGGQPLVRKKDGALALRPAQGPETVLVPKSCHGIVRHADATRGLLLVACDEKANGSAPLWMYGQGVSQKIGDIHSSNADQVDQPPERVVAISDIYVDMDARRAVPRPPLAPDRIRPITDWKVVKEGSFAERGDGAVLQLDRRNVGKRSFKVPNGPLFWRRRSK